jgi:hypothetical protein
MLPVLVLWLLAQCRSDGGGNGASKGGDEDEEGAYLYRRFAPLCADSKDGIRGVDGAAAADA